MTEKLGQLLSYLQREDVIQLQFRSGQPVMLHTTRRAHPVTASSLSSAQIRRFFDGTDVGTELRHDVMTAATSRIYSLLGEPHEVEIERSTSGLKISVRTDEDLETTHSGNTPTHDDLRQATSTRSVPRTSVDRTTRPTQARELIPRGLARPRTPEMGKTKPGIPVRPAAMLPRGKPTKRMNPLRDALRSARELGANEIRLSPGRPIQLKVATTWSETGATVVPDDVVEAMRSCLELRHLEQLASRGHVVRAHEFDDAGRWKIHVQRQHDGLGVHLRHIVSKPPSPAASGVPAAVLPWLQRRSGLVLLSGAPGSGKSTTLASLIQWINVERTVRIACVEACTELRFTPQRALITQREVWPPARGWVEALRHTLRHDLDVLTVDPISDPRVAASVLRASSTVLTLAIIDAPNRFDGVLRLQALARSGGLYDSAEVLATHLQGVLESEPRSEDPDATPSESPLLEVTEAVAEALRRNDSPAKLRQAAEVDA